MRKKLIAFTGMHFLVDLLCIYRLCSLGIAYAGGYTGWIIMAVLYNFLAFALPALIGLIADLADTGEVLAAIGCILTALPSFTGGSVWLMVVLQGIGNGCFHVGAGRRVLLESGKSYAPSGIFICSGALGVFLGNFWGNDYRPILMYGLGAALLLAAILLFLLAREQKTVAETRERAASGNFFSFAILMLLLVVVLRSFYGTVIVYEWKNTFLLKLIYVLCIVAGKGLGGVVADRIGLRMTAVLSLGGAALTVLLSEQNAWMGCVSILLFNMTMPLTLSLLAEYWKNYPGMAFGVLMLALFIGTLPDLLNRGIVLSVQALSVTCLISLLGLLIGMGKENRRRKG